MVSEASFLSSGFSIYTREILSRLHKTNKYEIAELACYGTVNDPRDHSIPWRYYANAVKENDNRYAEYNSRTDNQFGRWRFEKVLLDFKPDVVIDIRDYWMSSYQGLSPLRKYFHWILMPTVDSAPQQEEWIDTFLSADSIMTYSDWGADVLKEQGANKINYIDTVSPGVDLNIFRPRTQTEKTILRHNLNLPSDGIIFCSVMRNQKRKLIPELIKSFRLALDQLQTTHYDIGSKSYLYLHTSYPDAGWDLPELLKEHRLSNKVFFSYFCKMCGMVQANVFHGPSVVCPRCMDKSMVFSSVTHGVSTEQLSAIYGSCDAYVQYSICEGFGCPQTEAGACGLPIMTVNYSAMCDIINKLQAIPIQPAVYFKELETKANRAYPDNQQLAQEIVKIATMSPTERSRIGSKTRQLTESFYDWDIVAQKWEKHLDNIDATYRSNWEKTPTYMTPISTPEQTPPQQAHAGILDNICSHNLHSTMPFSSMHMLGLLQNADYGFAMHGINILQKDFSDIADFCNTIVNNNNQSERARTQKIKFNDDFIEYAHIKASTIN